MKITQVIKNDIVNIDKVDLSELIEIFNFKKRGKYFSSGRTCYYKLSCPVIINNTTYSYVKIKGCGALNGKSEFIKPGSRSFVRKDPHFGIDNNGYPTMVHSELSVYGGITLSRAIKEYNNFKYLYENKVSTLIPLFVYRYDRLYFNSEHLGISVSLCEDNLPLRMDKLLYTNDLMPKEYREFYKKVYFSEFGESTNLNFDDKAKLINKIAYKYACEIRKFADTGMYIHSGGWSNIQYSFSKKNVVLIDLDSSRKIKDFRISLMLNCRDLISNIYRLFINLYNPKCIGEYDEKIIHDKNYVLSLISGFFSTVDSQAVVNISKSINKFYIKNCFNKIKSIESIMLYIPKDEVINYELDIYKFYDYCMYLLYPLFFKYEKKNADKYVNYNSYERR